MASDVTLADMERMIREAVGDNLPKSVTWPAWESVLIRVYFEAVEEAASLNCSLAEAARLLHTVSTLGIEEDIWSTT